MAYLSGFIYWISIPLGGMALLMIGYLAKSSWGLLLRRPMEAAIRTLPLWILLFVPLVVFAWSKDYSPYFWTARKHTTPRNGKVRRCRTGRSTTHPDHPGRQVDDRTGSRHDRTAPEGQPRVPLEAGVPRRGARSLRDLGDDDLLPQQVGGTPRTKPIPPRWITPSTGSGRFPGRGSSSTPSRSPPPRRSG